MISRRVGARAARDVTRRAARRGAARVECHGVRGARYGTGRGAPRRARGVTAGRGFAPTMRMPLQPLRDIHRADLRDALDPRSWRVLANDGTPVGVVAEVIVADADARPVYLQVLP